MYLYILKCNNDRYYIGSTPDVRRRLEEHTRGKNRSTKYLLPVELMFTQKFQTLKMARQAEYWLKQQKDRALIVSIISYGKLTKSFV